MAHSLLALDIHYSALLRAKCSSSNRCSSMAFCISFSTITSALLTLSNEHEESFRSALITHVHVTSMPIESLSVSHNVSRCSRSSSFRFSLNALRFSLAIHGPLSSLSDLHAPLTLHRQGVCRYYIDTPKHNLRPQESPETSHATQTSRVPQCCAPDALRPPPYRSSPARQSPC